MRSSPVRAAPPCRDPFVLARVPQPLLLVRRQDLPDGGGVVEGPDLPDPAVLDPDPVAGRDHARAGVVREPHRGPAPAGDHLLDDQLLDALPGQRLHGLQVVVPALQPSEGAGVDEVGAQVLP